MKVKPIIADPMRLYELGLRNLMDMAILVYIGRCGIIGAKRKAIAEEMKVHYHTAFSGVDRLIDLGLVTSISRDHRPGSPHNFVCTLRGWDLLTKPADFSMFPHSQLALENHARKKSRNTTPENQTPAAHPPGIELGSRSDDDRSPDAAADPDTERKAEALGRETPGDETGSGTGEVEHAESAVRGEGPEAAGILVAVSLADEAPAG
jgi:hypothetical protein